jgi:hypothetical protein
VQCISMFCYPAIAAQAIILNVLVTDLGYIRERQSFPFIRISSDSRDADQLSKRFED